MNAVHAKDYLRRTGDAEILKANFTHDSEKGFCSYEIKPDALVVGQMYGDGGYWFRLLGAIARANGKNKIMGATRRLSRAKAFERKHGFRIVGYVLEKEI